MSAGYEDFEPLEVAELAALIDDVDPVAWHNKPIPRRRWLVPGLIPWRNVTLLGGDGGLGKSLLMLQLQAACALGGKWIGRDVEPVKSYGFFCEDETDEILRRLADITRLHGAEFGDLERMKFTAREGKNNILAMPNRDSGINPTKLYDALLARVKAFGAQLVVVDTIADTFGGNENYRSEVRTFVNLMRNIAIEIDGAVILTAHPSQAGLNTGSGISGSTAWNNSVRARLYLTRPPAQDGDEPLPTERILKTMKSNYAGITDDLELTWRDGVFIVPDRPTGMIATIEHSKADRAFLAALDAATAQGRNVSDYKSAQNYAPKVLAGLPEADGFKRQALEKAMHRLFATKAIAMGTVGLDNDRHPRRGMLRNQQGDLNV